MNLLEEKWLPIRRTNGKVDWIAPHQIVEPDVIALAANRADFNGALMQLLIGLLQTTTPIDDESDWEDLFDKPPTAEVLKKWFEPVMQAFVLDGDAARFMQDFGLASGEGTECSIESLLIDAAGGSAIDKNTDHFVKRNTIQLLCSHCIAAALFTLQTNAPAGGAGHRTSLRGGGPLTTLAVVSPSRSLWHNIWINVQPKSLFLEASCDEKKTAKHFTFPWLAEIDKIQSKGGETQPLQVHPSHLFWAMPRRIRINFSKPKTGFCDICKRNSAFLISCYYTQPHGLNYKGVWRHPFSPYYETPKEGFLPVHPQPGGFNYKNWLAWVFGNTQIKRHVEPALIVKYVTEEKRQKSNQLRLWVFGYDMDNMKPRCWYETTFPLYDLKSMDQTTRKNLQELIKNLIEGSEQSLFYLRQSIKGAWFGEGEMRGDLSFIDKTFWDSTEPQFYAELKKLIDKANSATGIDMDDSSFIISLGEAWLKIIGDTALNLFDADIVGSGAISQQNPRRIAEAYLSLKRNIQGEKIKTILRLPVVDKKEKVLKKVKTEKRS